MGTPSATPPADPMLAVRSLRTTPLSARTSGPFVPSPGNGPAVSSGIAAPVVALAEAVVVELVAADGAPSSEPHAASAAALAPVAIAPRARRRLIRRGRS